MNEWINKWMNKQTYQWKPRSLHVHRNKCITENRQEWMNNWMN